MNTFKIIIISIALNLGSTLLTAQDVNIDINALNEFQTMDGFGTSLRVFNDPHIIGGTTSDSVTAGLVISAADEDTILNLLYSNLGLTRVRPATGEDGAVEDPNDNNDPDSTDLSQFDFSWKRMDAHIEYVSRAVPLGVNTYFPSTIKIEDWMTLSNPEEYAEWAFAIIKRWKDQGYELPYFSIMNEPGYIRGGIWPGTYIRDCIKILGPKLNSAGIVTKLVIPDDLNSNEAFERSQVIMTDTIARQYVGALAYHLYGGNNANKTAMMELGQQYNVPVWMTEYSRDDAFDWANDMHDLIANYNVSAIDYMWGFFGQQSDGAQLISLNYSGTNYTGYTIEKQYYVTGQYSRYVRPGFQRIEAASSNADVRVTAYVDDINIAIVVINNHGSPQTVDFSVNGMNSLSTLRAVRTSLTENWADLPEIALDNGDFTTTLNANSITTFYSDSLTMAVKKFTNKSLTLNVYPNPSTGKSTLTYSLHDRSQVVIGIYDIRGKLVRNVLKDVQSSGDHQIIISSDGLRAGLYLIKLKTEQGEYSVRWLIEIG